jgi:L-serine dehydratase
MNISIFDIIGPIIIGPSSSHTAGAARLARIGAAIVNKPFQKVEFGLHGSFAKTGIGHGTDKALLAGVLGFRENDENIRNIYAIAAERGLEYKFYEVDLGEVHENSCKITLYHDDGSQDEVIASSIGGARIVINELNGAKLDVSCEMPTIIIRHIDKKGVIGGITQLLSKEQINIGIMRLTREERGGLCTTIIETDDDIDYAPVIEKIKQMNHIIEALIIKEK